MSTSQRRLRLAILSSHFADYSLELALELARRHAVLLLVDADRLEDECAPEIVAEARRSLRLHRFRQHDVLSRTRAAAEVAARLALFRPHALIAHEHGLRHVTVMQNCGSALGRTLLIVHDPRPHRGRDAEVAAGRGRQVAAQRRRAASLFTHGTFCARELADLGPPSASVVAIPHGPILVPVAAPPAPSGDGRLLMFGRMEAYKGLDVLLEACRRLDGRGACPPLHLLGAGPELDRLGPAFASLVGLTVHNRYASRSEIHAALAAADGVVLPYVEATHSGVAAGAFANGRAVLASAVGGLPDVVREGVNGRLVPAGDPAALAEAMHRFSREAASMSAGVLRTMHAKQAWAHVARALVCAAGG